MKKTISKTNSQRNQSAEFEKFKEFTRQLVNVPKEKINEKEKQYELQKQKEKANR